MTPDEQGVAERERGGRRAIGLVVHFHRDEIVDLAERAMKWAEEHDFELRLPPEDADLCGRPDLEVPISEFANGLDLCLSVGGDGTMLRAVDLVAAHGVAVLGVNAGRLGYLTEVDPDHLELALAAWTAGELRIQERMMLSVTVELNGASTTTLALNEVVLGAATTSRSVAIDAAISGRHFTSYLADGVIVATPTGSTAYSLSAGGPIVEPEFQALLLTPVAPHMVFDRSLVLAPSTEVSLTVSGYRDGRVAVDGRALSDLPPGSVVRCKAARQSARFVVFGGHDFHTVLKEKFGLTDR